MAYKNIVLNISRFEGRVYLLMKFSEIVDKMFGERRFPNVIKISLSKANKITLSTINIACKQLKKAVKKVKKKERRIAI